MRLPLDRSQSKHFVAGCVFGSVPPEMLPGTHLKILDLDPGDRDLAADSVEKIQGSDLPPILLQPSQERFHATDQTSLPRWKELPTVSGEWTTAGNSAYHLTHRRRVFPSVKACESAPVENGCAHVVQAKDSPSHDPNAPRASRGAHAFCRCSGLFQATNCRGSSTGALEPETSAPADIKKAPLVAAPLFNPAPWGRCAFSKVTPSCLRASHFASPSTERTCVGEPCATSHSRDVGRGKEFPTDRPVTPACRVAGLRCVA